MTWRLTSAKSWRTLKTPSGARFASQPPIKRCPDATESQWQVWKYTKLSAIAIPKNRTASWLVFWRVRRWGKRVGALPGASKGVCGPKATSTESWRGQRQAKRVGRKAAGLIRYAVARWPLRDGVHPTGHRDDPLGSGRSSYARKPPTNRVHMLVDK
jgi:hypothetical protein